MTSSPEPSDAPEASAAPRGQASTERSAKEAKKAKETASTESGSTEHGSDEPVTEKSLGARSVGARSVGAKSVGAKSVGGGSGADRPVTSHEADEPTEGEPTGPAGAESEAPTGDSDDPAENTPLALYADRPKKDSAGRADRLTRRPQELWAAAVFLTLAALPVAILGILLAWQPGAIGENIRQRITGAALNVDAVELAMRIGGVVLLVLAVVLGLLAWLAVRPRRRARTAATILVVLEVIGLVITMVKTSPDPVSIGVLLLAVAGTFLLYVPRSEEYMYVRR